MSQVKPSSDVARSHRRLGIALLVVGLLAIPTVSCQQLGFGSSEPERLLEEGRAASRQKDLETAYGLLKRIRTEYPASPESDEAFSLAALLWKDLWYRDRYTQPDSVWRTSEPQFMFDWLASFFAGPGEFPLQEVDALLRGMPYSLYGDFVAYAGTHPELSGWVFRVEEDDGHIRSVTGERAQAPAR
jgi:hypothetical protein